MSAPEKDTETGRFVTGNSGGGRPKGSRNKLGEAFIEALHDDFQVHGVEAIQTVRERKPEQYLRVIASIMPKDINLNVNNLGEMSDDELIERIRNLDATIRPFLAAQGEDGVDGGDRKATAH